MLEKFKQYVNQAEKLGKRVKNLRSDNGGEGIWWLFESKGSNTSNDGPLLSWTKWEYRKIEPEAARSTTFHAGMPKQF